jgi:hypothetical protein
MADPTHPDMTWHFRRLLEVVKGAGCALEGRWGWFAAPFALLTWIRTRGERREAAAAMAALQGMLEAFLGLVEDWRAGRLPACGQPEVDAEADGADCVDGAAAYATPQLVCLATQSPSDRPRARCAREEADGAHDAVAMPHSGASEAAPTPAVGEGSCGGPLRVSVYGRRRKAPSTHVVGARSPRRRRDTPGVLQAFRPYNARAPTGGSIQKS